MSDDEDAAETPSSDEREALRALPREAEPPAGLERKVLLELSRRGLVRSRASARRGTALAAALVLAFAAGRASARWSSVEAPPALSAPLQAGESWLLLLRGAPPEDAQPEAERIAAIREWAQGVQRAGVAVEGARLASQADWAGAGAPFEARSDLGGYFLLRGVDRERALEIARSCPFLAYGGHIEVRRLASS